MLFVIRLINFSLYLDLKKRVVKKHGEQSDIILPLECHFLNKNAFISVVGHQPQVIILKFDEKSLCFTLYKWFMRLNFFSSRERNKTLNQPLIILIDNIVQFIA